MRVVHLGYAKSQRFRSAAFGYLTPHGSFDRGAFGNSAKRFLRGAFQVLIPRSETVGTPTNYSVVLRTF
ncbi:hypothetical protein B2G51_02165 [Leptospira santarosai]|nr:hypothetical protein B2G51_02165 [Leptospira santarosai]